MDLTYQKRKKNPWYPLPEDYHTLTESGQRQARIATISDHSTPQKVVEAWDLFRRIYLRGLDNADPARFYDNWAPSPAFHYQAVYDLAQYGRNVLAAPRGFAKSIVVGTEIPLFISFTSKRFRRILMIMATDKLVGARFEKLMQQYTRNPLLLADFGEQKLKRGDGLWNHHYLSLANGATLEGFATESRKRGTRPDLIVMDDPEFDTSGETRSANLRQQFEGLLFRQLAPMLEEGSCLFWIGTMISRKSFIYYACAGNDPRFECWNRRVLAARNEAGTLLWPGKWGKQALDMKLAEIGWSNFSGEYLNNPISQEERRLSVEFVRNEYHIEGGLNPQESPLTTEQKVTWHQSPGGEAEPVQMQAPAGQKFSSMYRVLCFDYAAGMREHNDYSCAMVMGFDKSNVLWVLDMWMGRARETALLGIIYGMAAKWKVKVLGIEAVSIQQQFADMTAAYVHERAEEGWQPRVLPVSYPARTSKGDRIVGLEWRFMGGKIKLPAHYKARNPWIHLYAQIADFTPDLALLQHDDALDTLAMHQYILHGTGGTQAQPVAATPCVPEEYLGRGITHLGGVPVSSGMASNEYSDQVVRKLLDMKHRKRHNSSKARLFKRPVIVG